MDGNNRKCLSGGKEGMQRPGKIENVLEKIYARGRKVLCHGIGHFIWASGSVLEEVCGCRKNFSRVEAGAKG